MSCLHVNRSLSASFHLATADSEMERMRNGAGTAEADGNDSRKRECIATFVRASPEFLTFATHALLRLHFRQLKFIISDRKEPTSRCYRVPVGSFSFVYREVCPNKRKRLHVVIALQLEVSILLPIGNA